MFEFHLFAASAVYFNVSPRRDEGIAPYRIFCCLPHIFKQQQT